MQMRWGDTSWGVWYGTVPVLQAGVAMGKDSEWHGKAGMARGHAGGRHG